MLFLMVGKEGWEYGGESFRHYPSVYPEEGGLSIFDSTLGDWSQGFHVLENVFTKE
jgi:hypothetical protein